MKNLKKILSLIALFSVVSTSSGVPQPFPDECDSRTILEFILKGGLTVANTFDNNGTNFNILAHILAAGNNEQVLNVTIPGGITFFAPNDEAIMRTMRDLGFDGNQENQTYYDIVTFLSRRFANPIDYLFRMPLYHIVAPQMTSSALMQRSSFATFDSNLPLHRDGVSLVDRNPELPNAKLLLDMQNICTSNGYIHIIDRVLFSDRLQGPINIRENLDDHNGPHIASSQGPTVAPYVVDSENQMTIPFVSVEVESPSVEMSPMSYALDTELAESPGPHVFPDVELKPPTRIVSWVMPNTLLRGPRDLDSDVEILVRHAEPNPSTYSSTVEALPEELDATPTTELDQSLEPSQMPSVEDSEFHASVDLETNPIASEAPSEAATQLIAEEVSLPIQTPEVTATEVLPPSQNAQISPLVEGTSTIPHAPTTFPVPSEVMSPTSPSENGSSNDALPTPSWSTSPSVPSPNLPTAVESEDVPLSSTPITEVSTSPVSYDPSSSPPMLLDDFEMLDGPALPSPTIDIPFDLDVMGVTESPELIIAESPKETLRESPSASAVPDIDSCFPRSAVIHLSSGQDIRMENLEAGHRIMSSESKSSTVYLFSHRQPGGTYPFVRIVSEHNHSIVLSAEHYIYADNQLKPAQDVKVGDILRTLDGPSRVKRTSAVEREGLFAPHTMHGDIVVGRVIASSYTSALPYWIAHPILEAIRLPVRLGIMKEPLGSALYDGCPKWRDVRKWLPAVY